MHLASSYKHTREWEAAADSWREMIARGEGGTWPYIELAKYYEHIAKDIPQALACARSALRQALGSAPLTGINEMQLEMIRRRIARLQEKQRRLDNQSGNGRKQS